MADRGWIQRTRHILGTPGSRSTRRLLRPNCQDGMMPDQPITQSAFQAVICVDELNFFQLSAQLIRQFLSRGTIDSHGYVLRQVFRTIFWFLIHSLPDGMMNGRVRCDTSRRRKWQLPSPLRGIETHIQMSSGSTSRIHHGPFNEVWMGARKSGFAISEFPTPSAWSFRTLSTLRP